MATLAIVTVGRFSRAPALLTLTLFALLFFSVGERTLEAPPPLSAAALEDSSRVNHLAGAHAIDAGLAVEIVAMDSSTKIASASLNVTITNAAAARVEITSTTNGPVTITDGATASTTLAAPLAAHSSRSTSHSLRYAVADTGPDSSPQPYIDLGVRLLDVHDTTIATRTVRLSLQREGTTTFAGTTGSTALALRVFDQVLGPQLSPSDAQAQRTEVAFTTADSSLSAPRAGLRQVPSNLVEITGVITWSDRQGVRRHGFSGGSVAAIDDNGATLASGLTDVDGRYSLLVPPGSGIRVVVTTRTDEAAVWIPGEVGSTPYQIVSLPVDVPVGGQSRDVSFGPATTSIENRAMSVFQAIQTATPLAETVAQTPLPQVDVVYPTAQKSRFIWSTRQIWISEFDAYDWDVSLHELGHLVGRAVAIDAGGGGRHQIQDNLALTLGNKDEGMRLAWSEGFATFFGTMVQAELDMVALNIPYIGDTSYQDVEPTDADSFAFGVESGSFGRKGAADQVAVARALWDLYDQNDDEGDTVGIGLAVLDRLVVSSATNLFDAWNALTATMPTALRGEAGCIASVSGAAPTPSGPDLTSNDPPTFRWLPGGLGLELPSSTFRIQLFTLDFTEVLLDVNVGSASHYQPSDATWDEIAKNDSIVWMVTGQQNDAPVSRPIAGCAVRFDLPELPDPPQPTPPPTPVPQVAPVTTSATVSCLQNRGRIDVSIANNRTVQITAKVSVSGLSPRERTIAAGASTAVVFTGRADGRYEIRVETGQETVLNTAVDVACEPTMPPASIPPVAVEKSCLQSNGRIDVFLTNQGNSTALYAVYIDQVPPKIRSIGPSNTLRVTTTGRPDGNRPVRVTRDGVEVYNDAVSIACDIDTQGEQVVVLSSCLNSRGRFDVYLTNTAAQQRIYGVRLSGLTERSVTVEGEDTRRETVTGRADGTYNVVVRLGNTVVFTDSFTVECGG